MLDNLEFKLQLCPKNTTEHIHLLMMNENHMRLLMMNNLHGLWGHLYFIFQSEKSLLNQELMVHSLKLIN